MVTGAGGPTPPGVVDLGSAEQVLATGRAVVTIAAVGEVLLVRVRRGVLAMRNHCPHTGRTLSDAAVRGTKLRCHGHGRVYSMTTGRGSGIAGSGRLQLLSAWVDGGRLLIDTGPQL